MHQYNRNFLKDYLGDRWILVVDPAMNFRNTIQRFLSNLKVTRVKLVTSVRDAKRELMTLDVGFFISEWILNEENGLELCRYIRKKKQHKQTPFLLMTPENLRSDVVLASEAGIDGYLLKPFSYDDFVQQLYHLVRVAHNPNQLNVWLNQGYELLEKKKYRQAKQLFEKAYQENPRSARALCGLGLVAVQFKDDGTARKHFENALIINPDFLEGYHYLLDLYERIGDDEKHCRLAEKAHRLSPDNPKYTLLLAKAYFVTGDLVKSEMFFKKTLLLSPKLAEAYKGLGNVYFEQEEFDKAIKNYRKALDLEPRDIAILNYLGLSHVRKGLVVQGIDHYKMALRIDAYDWRVLFNLGCAYEQLGDIRQAVAALERALEVNPNYDKALRRLKAIQNKAAS